MTTAAACPADTAQPLTREETNIRVREWVDAFTGACFAPVDVVRTLPESEPKDVRAAVGALHSVGAIEKVDLGVYKLAGAPTPDTWPGREPAEHFVRALEWMRTEGARQGTFTTGDLKAALPDLNDIQIRGAIAKYLSNCTLQRAALGVYRLSTAEEAERRYATYDHAATDTDDADAGYSYVEACFDAPSAPAHVDGAAGQLTDDDLYAVLDMLAPAGFTASAVPHIAEWVRSTRTLIEQHSTAARS